MSSATQHDDVIMDTAGDGGEDSDEHSQSLLQTITDIRPEFVVMLRVLNSTFKKMFVNICSSSYAVKNATQEAGVDSATGQLGPCIVIPFLLEQGNVVDDHAGRPSLTAHAVIHRSTARLAVGNPLMMKNLCSIVTSQVQQDFDITLDASSAVRLQHVHFKGEHQFASRSRVGKSTPKCVVSTLYGLDGSRPEKLRVEVSLPRVQTSQDIYRAELNCLGTELLVESEHYLLVQPLGYAVQVETAQTKFYRQNHQLEVCADLVAASNTASLMEIDNDEEDVHLSAPVVSYEPELMPSKLPRLFLGQSPKQIAVIMQETNVDVTSVVVELLEPCKVRISFATESRSFNIRLQVPFAIASPAVDCTIANLVIRFDKCDGLHRAWEWVVCGSTDDGFSRMFGFDEDGMTVHLEPQDRWGTDPACTLGAVQVFPTTLCATGEASIVLKRV